MKGQGKKGAGRNTPQNRLRPRAHIMRTLGRELISSETVALIELVKNSYDADAERVAIVFEGDISAGYGSVSVYDDGVGMDFDTVTRAWLEPATSYKRGAGRRYSGKGRRVLGEKGIGRFASGRLADKLTLVTRAEQDMSETTGVFPWEDFDDEDKYLDEIDLSITTGPPEVISQDGRIGILSELLGGSNPISGTALRMEGLRSKWGKEELAELRRALSRLVSPFYEAKDFRIFLQLPEPFSEESEEIQGSELVRHPHYQLSGKVDPDGYAEVSLSVLSTGQSRIVSGHLIRVSSSSGDSWQISSMAGTREELPKCGPIALEINVWDRDELKGISNLLGTDVKSMRADLDEIAGINIYRDGFRVLPYGEPNTDWLRLDIRRVNFPKKRLSNNQIVGFVRIGADENPDLRDQSNREGLEDNPAFRDLRKILLFMISELESDRLSTRRKPNKPEEISNRKSDHRAPLQDLKSRIKDRYPADREALKDVEKAEKAVDENLEHARQSIARYRRLASLGTLIDMVIHDGRQPIHRIHQLSRLGLVQIEEDFEDPHLLEGLSRHFSGIQQSSLLVATLFRRIEPFGGGRKRGRPQKFYIEEIIESAFDVMETSIKRSNTEVLLPRPQTLVSVDRSELQEVVLNLLHNSLYWLEMVDKNSRKIAVDVKRLEGGAVVIDFSDSGPGVSEDAKDHIFLPFFTKKSDGTGIGLTIAGEIVRDFYDGDIELLDSGKLDGATFRITLNKRV